MSARKYLIAMCGFALFIAQPLAAPADTLYSAPDRFIGPGHSLDLSADRRARQVGDLVAVQFNFSVASSANATNAQQKAFSLAIPGTTGNARLLFFANDTGASAGSSSSSSKTKADASSFSTIMMASVVNILPSGALVIRGKQNVVVDGQKRALEVQGTMRYEDVDATDTVLSNRLADVSASFDGDNKLDHKGLIQKVLDVLF